VFVTGPWQNHWEPASNNHVLNSALMRAFIAVFGSSHLAVRAPALIGAAIYIGAAVWLCRTLVRERGLAWASFVCLTFNPLVFDYLVAARGYSLALAFLLCALIAGATVQWSEDAATREKACVACSISAGLSFSANFSFAFVNAAVVLGTLGYAWRAPRERWRTAAACLLPGLATAVGLCGWAVLRWPKGQLSYGAWSIGEMLGSVLESSTFEPNRDVINPLLFPLVEAIRPWLIPAVLAAAIAHAVALWRRRGAPRDARAGRAARLAWFVAAVLAAALAGHYAAFRAFGLLLPKDRTAIYLAPLCALVVGVLASNGAARKTGRAARVLLAATAVYFLLCLRLTYFKEWQWDAEVDRAYATLAYYNRAHGVEEVGSKWMYAAALNYYRITSGRETICKIVSHGDAIPEGKEAYVLHRIFDAEFLEEHRLKVVFEGKLSGMIVAVSPEVEERNACAAREVRDIGAEPAPSKYRAATARER
jgi:hypothetical protein